jgi:hypothetical protein
MSAESTLTAVAVVKALLNEDTGTWPCCCRMASLSQVASSWPAWPA